MKKWFLIVLTTFLALVALVFLVGMFIPSTHLVSSRATFHASPNEIWALITDHAEAARWREEVERVERGPDRDGQPVWIEHSDFGPLPLAVIEADEPRRYVTEIADPEMPFGGTWTFELTPAGEDTTVVITESGVIRSTFFRTMARFVFGYHATMDGYLVSLGKELESPVEPEHVE